jgi:glycosyltransferase involved in cell wall biosynthesis
MLRRRRVSYIFPISHHFRYPFHLKLRELLDRADIDYTVCHCAPFGENLAKKDTVEIPWGRRTPLFRLGGAALLQWSFADAIASDLVILQQENRLLFNYPCQIASRLGLRKVAFFGHGRNFQAVDPNSPGETWKRFWATKVDWWFGYTEETRRFLAGLGFPAERITVFNNAVDTTGLSAAAAALDPAELDRLRGELGLSGGNVGVYVGGLYAEKRLAFLIESLDRIRAAVPGFEFIAVGGGPESPFLQQAAASRPWLKATGPKFGRDKVALMALGQLFLIPGLVGLAILDAGVMGLPVVTTNYPWHSPEIAYLEPGRNGVIVRPWDDADAYAGAVIDLLKGDPERRAAMSRNAREIAAGYTIESMAGRFAEGVLHALEAHKR